jgi:DNA-binding CsgD family transcriptional regulator
VGENALWWTGLGLHIAAIRHDEAGVRRYGAALTRAAIARGAVDPQLLHDLVRAMLHGGVPADAVEELLDGLPIGFGQPTPQDDPYRLLARAELLEARDDLEGALELYDASIARSGSQVRPAALGSAHVGAGRCLVALRRLGEAKEHAAIAGELLAHWGGARVEELAMLQRRLGGRDSVEGPDALTPREREVVALLAEGLTNGEIASRLFISPKTASVHVSNILAKLSMTSRTEVAAYAVRAGWADA